MTAPIHEEYEALLDAQIGRLVACRALAKAQTGSFDRRYAAVLAASALNISLTLINGPVVADTYHKHCGPAVFDLLRHASILDLVESVIGSEIASNPVQQRGGRFGRVVAAALQRRGNNLAPRHCGAATRCR